MWGLQRACLIRVWNLDAIFQEYIRALLDLKKDLKFVASFSRYLTKTAGPKIGIGTYNPYLEDQG